MIISNQMNPEPVSLVIYNENHPHPSEEIHQKLNQEEVQMPYFIWKTSTLGANINSWAVVKLYITNPEKEFETEKCSLLKDISKINFPNLKVLHFCENRIESIEPLSRVRIPLLEKLVLWSNIICSTENLKKENWPNLNSLCLNGNKINEVNFLTKIQTDNIDELILEEDNLPDLRFLAKLKATKFRALGISNKSEVKFATLTNCLMKKYKGFSVNQL